MRGNNPINVDWKVICSINWHSKKYAWSKTIKKLMNWFFDQLIKKKYVWMSLNWKILVT